MFLCWHTRGTSSQSGLPQRMKTDPVLPADLLKRLQHQAELDGLSLAEDEKQILNSELDRQERGRA
jgi:hypothetical protein